MRKLWLLILLFCTGAQAHQLSTSYLQASIDTKGVIEGKLQLRFYDLDQSLNIDTNGDGQLRWGELQEHRAAIEDFINKHLKLARAQHPCTLAVEQEWQIDEHFNEGYLLLPLRAQCGLDGAITLDYNAFFNRDGQHKLLVNFSAGKTYENRVVSSEQPQIMLVADSGSRIRMSGEFIYQGMVHIWMGFDHILFLCALLLPSVLTRHNHQWVSQPDLRIIIKKTFWLVTAFTLAHSITLTATALNIMQVPSRWVETGIALSIMCAALNNIYPLVLRLGALTFGFGLLHGMGFAGALGELGIPADQQLLSVVAFNLGVEIGQMAILLIVLPILILVRNQLWYSRYSLNALSLLITLMAAQWAFQRAFF